MQGPDKEEPTQTLVAIDSLGGRHMQLYLHKRPGFEREDVLGGDLDEREGERPAMGVGTLGTMRTDWAARAGLSAALITLGATVMSRLLLTVRCAGNRPAALPAK